MNYIIGFKAYNHGLINRYGEKYEIGVDYALNPNLKWKSNGFHFSKNLEDVLRYYDGFDEIDICLVIGYGNIKTFYDDYNDYETIVSDHLRITRVLSREEILNYAKNLSDNRLCRFISGFYLTEDEQEYLSSERCEIVSKYIKYYQCGDKDAFKR